MSRPLLTPEQSREVSAVLRELREAAGWSQGQLAGKAGVAQCTVSIAERRAGDAGQHPLAKKARALCEAREHSMRRRVGKTACGECWETVIRADERTVNAALAGDSAPLRSAS